MSTLPNNTHFEFQEEPILADEEVLNNGISDEAVLKKNMDRIKPFRIYIKDQNRIVLGGISGTIIYGSLYIDMLWLNEKLRHQGLGKKLMMEAEEVGLKKNCKFVTVHTMDWEALTFYQKLGFDIEFVREGYQNDSKMYILRKKLS